MSQKIKLVDILGETKSFVHAIFLAANGLGEPDDTNAMQVMAEQVLNRLESALNMLDEMPYTFGSVLVDPKAIHKAVKAEIARRKLEEANA